MTRPHISKTTTLQQIPLRSHSSFSHIPVIILSTALAASLQHKSHRRTHVFSECTLDTVCTDPVFKISLLIQSRAISPNQNLRKMKLCTDVHGMTSFRIPKVGINQLKQNKTKTYLNQKYSFFYSVYISKWVRLCLTNHSRGNSINIADASESVSYCTENSSPVLGSLLAL